MNGDALALKDVKTSSGAIVQGRTLLENGIIATLDMMLDDFATDAVLLVGKTKKTLKNQLRSPIPIRDKSMSCRLHQDGSRTERQHRRESIVEK